MDARFSSRSKARSYFGKNAPPYVANQTKTSAAQKALLEEIPLIYDIIIFISLYSEHKKITPKDIEKELNISSEEVKLVLRKLRSVNILPVNSTEIAFTDWFIIPDNDQFRGIRKRNFSKFMKRHLASQFDELYSIQNLTVRLASRRQVEDLKEKIYSITQWFMNLKEEELGSPYSLMIGGGVFSFKNSEEEKTHEPIS